MATVREAKISEINKTLGMLSDAEVGAVLNYAKNLMTGNGTGCIDAVPYVQGIEVLNQRRSSKIPECIEAAVVEGVDPSLLQFVSNEVSRHKKLGHCENGSVNAVKSWFRAHRTAARSLPAQELTKTMDLVEYASDKEAIAKAIATNYKQHAEGLSIAQFLALVGGLKMKSLRGDLTEDLLPCLHPKEDKNDLLNGLESLLTCSQYEVAEQEILRPDHF